MDKEKTLKFIENALKVVDQPDIISALNDYKSKVEGGSLLNKEDWMRISQLLGLSADVAGAQAQYAEDILKSEEDYLSDITEILNQANNDMDSASSTLGN